MVTVLNHLEPRSEMRQEVILVDENDEATGIMEKMEAHQKGYLHRAFSIFIFNIKSDMLLQLRASEKYHSGGLWTNACCGHPHPSEDTLNAAHRRLYEEMGIRTNLQEIFSFTYRHVFANGLTEHEFDHVFAGICEAGEIVLNPQEASAHCYMSMDAVQSALRSGPAEFTPWFHIAFPQVQRWLLSRQGSLSF